MELGENKARNGLCDVLQQSVDQIIFHAACSAAFIWLTPPQFSSTNHFSQNILERSSAINSQSLYLQVNKTKYYTLTVILETPYKSAKETSHRESVTLFLNPLHVALKTFKPIMLSIHLKDLFL